MSEHLDNLSIFNILYNEFCLNFKHHPIRQNLDKTIPLVILPSGRITTGVTHSAAGASQFVPRI